MAEILEIQQEVELYGMGWYDPTCYAIEMIDATYEKVSTYGSEKETISPTNNSRHTKMT
jgi:hypothetical protein